MHKNLIFGFFSLVLFGCVQASEDSQDIARSSSEHISDNNESFDETDSVAANDLEEGLTDTELIELMAKYRKRLLEPVPDAPAEYPEGIKPFELEGPYLPRLKIRSDAELAELEALRIDLSNRLSRTKFTESMDNPPFSDREAVEILIAAERASDALFSIIKDDNRSDITVTQNTGQPRLPQIRSYADSVMLVMHKDEFSHPDGYGKIKHETYKNAYKKFPKIQPQWPLCETHGLQRRFLDQPVFGFCTAFLIGPIDLRRSGVTGPTRLVTAGHCFGEDLREKPSDATQYEHIRFIRGHYGDGTVQASYQREKEEVWRIKSVVDYKNDQDVGDYAIIELDRPVHGAKSLVLDKAGASVTRGEKVYMLGHPIGLPMKLSDEAIILRADSQIRFDASLDSFMGNSGSPVFNRQNNKVIGVLSKGAPDFKRSSERNPDGASANQDCLAETVCENGCALSGIKETATRVSLFER